MVFAGFCSARTNNPLPATSDKNLHLQKTDARALQTQEGAQKQLHTEETARLLSGVCGECCIGLGIS